MFGDVSFASFLGVQTSLDNDNKNPSQSSKRDNTLDPFTTSDPRTIGVFFFTVLQPRF